MEKLNIDKLKIYEGRHKFYVQNYKQNFIDKNCLDELKTLGDNSAEVLVIVNHIISNIDSEENILLNKILEAVGLSIAKTFVISKPNLGLNLLWRYLTVNKCLIFGIDTKELGLHINMEPYQPTTFNNKIVLLSNGIEDLKKHPEKKKQLWKALQNMFR